MAEPEDFKLIREIVAEGGRRYFSLMLEEILRDPNVKAVFEAAITNGVKVLTLRWPPRPRENHGSGLE